MIQTESKSESRHLYQAIRMIKVIQTIDPQMQAQTIMCFLMVAQFGPCPMADIRAISNVSQASLSRNFSALGEVHRRGMPGFGLIKSWEDPMNRKAKLVKLTKKGEEFKKQIMDVLSEEFTS